MHVRKQMYLYVFICKQATTFARTRDRCLVSNTTADVCHSIQCSRLTPMSVISSSLCHKCFEADPKATACTIATMFQDSKQPATQGTLQQSANIFLFTQRQCPAATRRQNIG